ncbi:VanZ family protein [Streptomyces sp. NPDC097704]|uniref:VanZ family protein n=1 Tax=Streptomyces sp. NPDC097704 TaxID=3157101 RepID=UPI003318E31D
MIDAFLGANPFLGPSLVLIILTTAIVARPLYRRRGRAALAWLGAAASGTVVLVATLAPLGPHAPASRMCSVPEDFAAALVADQALLNIALFAPLGFFLTLSTRRPVTVLPALAVLSGAIEVTQALVPGMARACDVSDLGANALGALAGCLAAVAWRRRRAAASPAPGRAGRHDVRNGVVVTALGGLLLSAVAVPAVGLTLSDADASQRPNAEQLVAASDATRAFFGPGVAPTDVRYVPAAADRPGRLEVSTPTGALALAWPSGEPMSGQLAAFVPEKAAAKLTDESARETGAAFARAHFPWALRGSRAQVYSAGGPDQQARVVQWRARADGVLLPMRLDLVVGGGRKVLSFAARNEQAPALPPVRMSREQATTKALAAHPDSRVTGSDLIARRDGRRQWRVVWLVSLTPPTSGKATPASPPSAGTPAPGSPPRTDNALYGMAFDAETGAPFGDPTRPRR